MKKLVLAAALLVSGSAIAKEIGKVNGYSISQKDADRFVKQVTRGKLTYSQLSPKDKKDVVMRLATDKLILKNAYKSIPKAQQQQIITNVWLRSKAEKEKISSAEIKKAYDKNKDFFKDKKGKVIPFSKAKVMIKESLLEKKVVAKIMKKAKITMGGKVISAPKSGKSSSSKKSSKGSKNSSSSKVHTVVSGDTLSGIAKKNGTTTAKIRALNKMDNNSVIKIGQKIKLP